VTFVEKKKKLLKLKMYILILLLPLLGSIFAGLFGRFFGRDGSAFLSTLSLFLS
jgi:NADH:ubiquinone oxidoreductase subunit 5 (subunit L)/multisubunit Na+/H+ antiporter MnhA subunit